MRLTPQKKVKVRSTSQNATIEPRSADVPFPILSSVTKNTLLQPLTMEDGQ